MSAPALAALAGHGELRRASELADFPDAATVPVSPEVARLLPWPGLRRGAIVSAGAAAQTGLTSLMLALLSQASQSGAWCAVVGAAGISAAAASQAGVVLSRLALVADPSGQWEAVVAALLDGIDVVAVNAIPDITMKQAQRLAARARRRGTLLIPFGPAAGRWPSADAALRVEHVRWHGLAWGAGLLKHCELQVTAQVRGRPRHSTVWPYGKPVMDQPDLGATELAPVISLRDHRLRQKGVMAGARTRGAVS
ncbi:MAG: hypothetical protein ACRD0P_18145 [Stackebrandtia sp.]